MNTMKHVELVAMAKGEEFQAAIALSNAMVSNPIHIAVYQGQGETERKQVEDMFYEMFQQRRGEVFVAKHDNAIVGAIRWRDCHEKTDSHEDGTAASAIDEASLYDTASRIAYWYGIWRQKDPLEPHKHLGPIGVNPDFQGKSIGSELMQIFCRQVDANNEAAYLETDRPVNVRFYGKFGFHVIGETDIFDIKNYFMWRPAIK
jgi:GNAT superfamily N-acetyltransferase